MALAAHSYLDLHWYPHHSSHLHRQTSRMWRHERDSDSSREVQQRDSRRLKRERTTTGEGSIEVS